MIIANLTFKVDVAEIEKQLQPHLDYLDVHYAAQHFLCSGAKPKRAGGAIIILTDDIKQAQQWLNEDPFYQHQIADYQLIEFKVTKCLAGLEPVLQPVAE